jgi:hypothetical protein
MNELEQCFCKPCVAMLTVRSTTADGGSVKNKIGKVYSFEYTNIPKAFFSPHHIGR